MENGSGYMFAGNTTNNGGVPQTDMLRQFHELADAQRLVRAASSVNTATISAALSPLQSSAPQPMVPQGLFAMLSGNPTLARLVDPNGKQNFLSVLHELHLRRGTPLPPDLTGIQNSIYDATNSPFRSLELGNEPGLIRLAGQDLDLFKLWQILLSNNFSMKITQNNSWPQITAQIGIQVNQQTVQMTQQIAQHVLHPMEQYFITAVQALRRNAAQNQAQSQPAQTQPMSSTSSNPPETPVIMPGRSSATPAPHLAVSVPPETPAATGISGTPVDEQESRKRKAEDGEDDDSKRVKRKTEEDNSENKPSTDGESKETAPEVQVLRRKIEYVPALRLLSTHGGRDLSTMDTDYTQIHARRPYKAIEEYGSIDIEALTLSIRSRVKVEVCFALGILSNLSWVRAGGPQVDSGAGLPLHMCEDLGEVLLEFAEETAFGDISDSDEPDDSGLAGRLITNKQIARLIYEREQGTFAGLDQDKETGLQGPDTPPWEMIFAVAVIFNNLASVNDNPLYYAKHPRILDVLLRMCMLDPTQPEPTPLCKKLKLHHLLRIRKEVIHMIAHIGNNFNLTQSPLRTTKRLYALICAAIMDPDDCHSPSVQQAQSKGPSPFLDVALDGFSRISQPDGNRAMFTKAIPSEQIWSLLQHLSRLLPVTDTDITAIQTEAWMAFIYRIAMSIYSLVVFAPNSLRRKIRSNTALRTALTRFMRACTRDMMGGAGAATALYRAMTTQVRESVNEYWRRVVEILKIIDEEQDPLATFQAQAQTSSTGGSMVGFGIGGSYGAHNSKPPPRGNGVLGGVRGDFLWGAVLQAAAPNGDMSLFDDWDTLVRVDSATART